MIELADLRGLPTFEGVTDETLRRVLPHVADVRVDEGQWLVREGESPAFYVLLSGSFDLMKRYADGVRRLAVRSEPGDYLGELPIVFGTPFFAGARAASALRVARFDRAQFGVLVRDSQVFSDRLVASIQERVEGLETQAAGPLRLPIVLGSAHDPHCHGLRDFLSRNQVRFEWADPGRGVDRGPARPPGRARGGRRVLGRAAARRPHPQEPDPLGARGRRSACRSSRATTSTTS